MAKMTVKSGQRIDVETASDEVIVQLPDLILTLSPSDASKFAELLSLASRQAFIAGNSRERIARPISCGCAETYPQLQPGKLSHAPGCRSVKNARS